jgi:hypothetical protein
LLHYSPSRLAHVHQFIVTLLVVTPSLTYLEKLWGSLETLKFVVISVGFSNLIAFVFTWLEFIVTRNDRFL